MEKIKLTTTLNLIKAKHPCGQEPGCGKGWGRLITYLGKDYDHDAEINLLTILNSNGIDDFFWAFRAAQQEARIVKQTAASLAIAFAEEVLPIWEEKHPQDKRPRRAIQAAKDWVENPTEENLRRVAKAAKAADAAWATAKAAEAAAEAARAARAAAAWAAAAWAAARAAAAWAAAARAAAAWAADAAGAAARAAAARAADAAGAAARAAGAADAAGAAGAADAAGAAAAARAADAAGAAARAADAAGAADAAEEEMRKRQIEIIKQILE